MNIGRFFAFLCCTFVMLASFKYNIPVHGGISYGCSKISVVEGYRRHSGANHPGGGDVDHLAKDSEANLVGSLALFATRSCIRQGCTSER